jgi:RNA polymerase sigma-70 factor (ECF subfamily)
MNRLAPLPPRMDDQASASPPDQRRTYEEILVRAMRYAARIVSRDQAFEIAHDVAVEMLRRPAASQTSGPLLYLAVTSKLRNAARATQRRAAREGAYLETRSAAVPAWAQPGADLEAGELRERIQEVVARMPSGMREVFLLVREEELSYKETATRLGVSVGTVHTQLSRAAALLRECVKRYQADSPNASRSRKGR